MKINYRYILSFGLLLFTLSVVMGESKTHIAALEGDENYMSLVGEEQSISFREDSLSQELATSRAKYNEGGVDKESCREQIFDIEQQLLDLRVEKSGIINQINAIEQQWSLDNMSSGVAEQSSFGSNEQGEDRAESISKSRFAAEKLSSSDLETLRKVESQGQQLNMDVKEYAANYQKLALLKLEYEQATSQSDADEKVVQYNALDSLNGVLASKISREWLTIADEKSFGYALLMESAGFADVFEIEERLKIEAAESIESRRDETKCWELLNYHFSYLSMTELEIAVAERLKLPEAQRLLRGVSDSLRMSGFDFPNIQIEERLFLDYADVIFSTNSIYTSANPIPFGEVYERGVIYRLLVGSFKARQAASLFRGASPICIIKNEEGMFSYYIAGYKTLSEAESARKLLLEKGFRRPEVVEWRDGERRNLTTNPRREESKYRVEISGVTELTPDMRSVIETQGEGRELSKIGASTFVVGVFDTFESATNLVESLKIMDSGISVLVKEME